MSLLHLYGGKNIISCLYLKFSRSFWTIPSALVIGSLIFKCRSLSFVLENSSLMKTACKLREIKGHLKPKTIPGWGLPSGWLGLPGHVLVVSEGYVCWVPRILGPLSWPCHSLTLLLMVVPALQAQPQALLLAEALWHLELSDRPGPSAPVNLRGCTRPTHQTTHSDIKMSQKFPRPAFP